MPKTDDSFDPTGYATVAQRITLFYRRHPTGRIETELVERTPELITFRARVFRGEADLIPAATGWASEREGDGDVNTVACLENTETSAIGRALANLGLTAAIERPSVEEMRKAARARVPKAERIRVREHTTYVSEPAVNDDADQATLLTRVLTLLTEAELQGLHGDRARELRTRLEHDVAMTSAELRELEAKIRAWMARRR